MQSLFCDHLSRLFALLWNTPCPFLDHNRSLQYIDLAQPKSGALVSLFSSLSLCWIKTVTKSSALAVEVFLQWIERPVRGVGRWGRIDEVWTWGRCSHNYTHTSQRYLQTAYDFRRCSWCCDQIFQDRECFLLQMKCMLSASVEIISYWARLIISVWENEPKLKETTLNHFALRHYWWIEVYTCS